MSNIGADGKWLKTEEFVYKNKTTVRTAGTSCGNIMLGWRKLRDEKPLLFDQISIMSQPASNCDSIIMSWSIEEMSEAFVCSLWQRDCFAVLFSDHVMRSLFLSQQLSTTIAAKMTASLQLTDTDFS